MPKNIHVATYQPAAKKLEDVLKVRGDHRALVRLGGQMEYAPYDIQINSTQSIRNSIDKSKQKELLLQAGLSTLPLLKEPVFPCVIKGKVRSCGISVKVLANMDQFNKIMPALREKCQGYMLEPLFNATGEYRLHCTRKEVFFMVKKIKRNPEDVIINHENHYNVREFPKPRLLEQMKAECLKAMNVLDLDIACFDVMYNSSDNNKHDFTIAEANTNPELLKNTFDAYTKVLNELIELAVKKKEEEPQVQKEPKPNLPQEKNLLSDRQKCQLIEKIMRDDYIFDDEGEFVKIYL